MHEAASLGAVTFATGIAGETAAGILFVFTVSSFCTSAPEEREEKPRNRAFGYVAKSDALSRQRRRRLPVAVPSRKKPSRRAPKKSTWGFSERDDTRLRAQMRTEANRRGRGAEKRAGAKQRGPRKGAGASRAESKAGSDQMPRGQLAQGSAKPRRAQGGAKLRPARGRAALRLATLPQRRLGDNRRPTYARAAANLGVPLPQQVRCRGAHRAKKRAVG